MNITILLLSIVIFFPPTLRSQEKNKTKKPNVVYILTDQWRASALGYAGNPDVKTPNLDKFSKKAVNFTNAVSIAPVCTPHRAALMTGRRVCF
ncbi:sulfatase-like hydrolase/transferase [Zobellia roscoffensis]|uniref:sulfatase-like hydrolase/transferase n=1 Tax=Zobellia roscoffensis TaxID=2779508 RepID=UPI00188A45EE|nr:sulfatase-like hydrolase/transferase [Zobellia roscoffensis]